MNRAERRASARYNKGTYSKQVAIQAKPARIETEYTLRRVFRIEHPESGKGPFVHNAGPGRFASDAMVCLAEPSEFNAPQLRGGSGHIYAFIDPWALMSAVHSLVILREYGFHFTIYDSNEHVVLPDGQVAFVKDKAKKIASYPVHEFPFDDYF